MTKCPFCQQEIENDSFYCDQCGEALNICPSGHGFKKGKICNECGTKLVAASTQYPQSTTPQAIAQTVTDVSQQQTVVHPQNTITSTTSADTTQAEKTVRPNVAAAEPHTLVCSALNAKIDIKDGGIIGRRNGDYTHIFGNQGYVSGSHARLQKNNNKWEIVDLDSTNGTFLNNNKLSPNMPAAFNVGDIISFYDIKFTVE